MNLTTQILLSILTSATVSTFIVTLFKTYISSRVESRIKNEYDKKLEDFKSKIRQIEYLRNSRYDALKELNNIYYKIYPEKTFPDMEWEDALFIIAGNFDKHEKLLKNFLKEYNHILDKEVTGLVENAIFQCIDGKLEIDEHQQLECADKLFKKVEEAKDSLFNKLNPVNIK